MDAAVAAMPHAPLLLARNRLRAMLDDLEAAVDAKRCPLTETEADRCARVLIEAARVLHETCLAVRNRRP